MKNILLISLFAIVAMVCSSFQNSDSQKDACVAEVNSFFNREIMGVMLGETKLDSAKAIMEKRGYKMERKGLKIKSQKEVGFGDKEWTYMDIMANKDSIVDQILFVLRIESIEEIESAKEFFEELSNFLYPRCKTLSVENTNRMFEDDSILFIMGFELIKETPHFYVSYIDKFHFHFKNEKK